MTKYTKHDYFIDPAEYLFRRSTPTPSGCREWTGAVDTAGYGKFGVGGFSIGEGKAKYFRASKASYETFVGPIPPGMFVCHACDNPRCIAPAHLWLGTSRQNTRDMFSKSRGRQKLTVEQVRQIRAHRGWLSNACLAETFGVTATHIVQLLKGRGWEVAA